MASIDLLGDVKQLSVQVAKTTEQLPEHLRKPRFSGEMVVALHGCSIVVPLRNEQIIILRRLIAGLASLATSRDRSNQRNNGMPSMLQVWIVSL
jgi:hypothetical protein